MRPILGEAADLYADLGSQAAGFSTFRNKQVVFQEISRALLGLPCKRKGVAGGQRPPRWPGGADGVPPPAVSVVGYGNASGGHNSPISRPGGGGAPIKGLYVFLDRHYGSQPGGARSRLTSLGALLSIALA